MESVKNTTRELLEFSGEDPTQTQRLKSGRLGRKLFSRSRRNKDRIKGELPKVAASTSRSHALLRCLIHVPAIAVTTTVLALNFANVYWMDLGTVGQNTVLGALQFAVKLHESFIVASLSTVVFHRLQYELACKEGVSFGTLLAGYQLNSASYLFSAECWGGIRAQKWAASSRNLRRWSLSLVVFGAIILAALSGPASGVLVIPKLAWWLVSDPPDALILDPAISRGPTDVKSCVNDRCLPAHLYPSSGWSYSATIANTSLVWPDSLTAAYLPGESCLSSMFKDNASCPAGGYAQLAQAGSIQQNPAKSKTQWNVTFRDDNIARSVASETDQISWSISSSVSQVTAKLLWQVWSIIEHETDVGRPQLRGEAAQGSALLKPLVQVECAFAGNGSTTRTLTFPHNYLRLPPLKEHGGITWTSDTTLLLNDAAFNDSKPMHFSWVNLSEYTPSPSLAAAFCWHNALPSNQYDVPSWDGSTSVSEINHTNWNSTALFTCSIDARWAPVRIWVDPRSDDLVHQNSPSVLGMLKSGDFHDLQPIHIDPGWAKSLEVPVAGSGLTAIESLLDAYWTSELNGAVLTTDFSRALGMFIADGLARVGLREPLKIDSKRHRNGGYYADHREWIQVRVTMYRLGYGYGMSGKLFSFAAAILLLHVAVSLGHIIVTLAFRPWTSGSWATVGGIVALAMNSKPTEKLQNTCAGVAEGTTFNETVKIREVSDGHLELVFDEDDEYQGHYKQLRPGKQYGGLQSFDAARQRAGFNRSM